MQFIDVHSQTQINQIQQKNYVFKIKTTTKKVKINTQFVNFTLSFKFYEISGMIKRDRVFR